MAKRQMSQRLNAATAGRQAPGLQLLKRYSSYLDGAVDVQWNPLYDYGTYAAAGATNFAFFQVPVGQSSKTFADTNMELAGQLSAGENFLCVGIEMRIWPNIAIASATANSAFADDVYKISKKNAWLEFTTLSKVVLREAPLENFPSQTGLEGFATAGSDDMDVLYARLKGPTYWTVPTRLESGQQFKLAVYFPTAQAVSADTPWGFRLLGYKFRNAY